MSFSLEGVPSYAKDAWTVQVRITHSFVVSSILKDLRYLRVSIQQVKPPNSLSSTEGVNNFN